MSDNRFVPQKRSWPQAFARMMADKEQRGFFRILCARVMRGTGKALPAYTPFALVNDLVVGIGEVDNYVLAAFLLLFLGRVRKYRYPEND